METNTEMKIFVKTYDFIIWALNHTQKFPKSSRFSISVRLENKLLDFLESIMIANRKKYKTDKLVVSDEILEQIRILFRISKDMKFLNLNSYEYAAGQLTEIGKMLGGWLKTEQPKGMG